MLRFASVMALLLSSTAVVAKVHPAEVPVKDIPPLRSADYRNDQKAQVTAGLGGVLPYLGFGVNFGWFRKPNSLLTFSYFDGVETSDFFLSLFSDHEETHVQLLSAGHKQFFFNSFYIEGTGFVRRMRQVSYDHESHSVRNEETRFLMDSLGGTFAIGNQWQWPTFTIGCDWIGVGIPLVHGPFKERVTSILNEGYVAEERSDFKASAKDPFPILVRFYLGYSF